MVDNSEWELSHVDTASESAWAALKSIENCNRHPGSLKFPDLGFQGLGGAQLNMLDCKMSSSLSPVTPSNLLSEVSPSFP